MRTSWVEEGKGRAAFAFCSTLPGMQLQSKRYAPPAIHRSTKRPFPPFTSGVRNQGGSGVWSSPLRLNNSAVDENAAEIPNQKSRLGSFSAENDGRRRSEERRVGKECRSK